MGYLDPYLPPCGIATTQMLQQISTRRDVHVPDTIPSSLEHHLSQNQLSQIFPLDLYGDNMFLTTTSDGLQLKSSHAWQASSEMRGRSGHRGKHRARERERQRETENGTLGTKTISYI